MRFGSIALAIVMAAVLAVFTGCGSDLKISGGSATQSLPVTNTASVVQSRTIRTSAL